jgi:hypothetical protein
MGGSEAVAVARCSTFILEEWEDSEAVAEQQDWARMLLPPARMEEAVDSEEEGEQAKVPLMEAAMAGEDLVQVQEMIMGMALILRYGRVAGDLGPAGRFLSWRVLLSRLAAGHFHQIPLRPEQVL